MPDGLSLALATPGIAWLALTIAAAGLVRGFAGFGTALVFMPVAAGIVPPAHAIVVLTITELASWPLMMPRALRHADRREVIVLAAPAILTAPLGVWLLKHAGEDVVRIAVAGFAVLTLAALVTGWRYAGRVGWPGLFAVGGSAGVLGGMTGLTGPPMILFYLSGPGRAEQVRANAILFLALLDIGIIANILVQDLATLAAIWLGAILTIPYLAMAAVGQALFRPENERLYRGLAYGIIALAILGGLPLTD